MIGAILGAIGLGTNLLGGLFGKSAAQKAAETQAAEARAAGEQAVRTAGEVNPLITGAARASGEQARTAAGESIARVDQSTGAANALLDPYTAVGGKAAGLLSTALDNSGHMPTLDELQIDPGYAFRTAEALKARTSRAAALGLATGGGTEKALDRYAQQDASQEYANAFARYNTTRQQNIENLRAISGQGQQAAETEGGNLLKGGIYGADLNYGSTTYAGDKNYDATVQTGRNSLEASRVQGDYLTQAANAEAAGTVGGTNSLWNGITSGVGSLTSGLTIDKILKNPANRFIMPAAGFKTIKPLPGLDTGVAA